MARVIIPIIFGCGKKLSREDAAQFIKQKYSLPIKVIQYFQFTQNQQHKSVINYLQISVQKYLVVSSLKMHNTSVLLPADISAKRLGDNFSSLKMNNTSVL